MKPIRRISIVVPAAVVLFGCLSTSQPKSPMPAATTAPAASAIHSGGATETPKPTQTNTPEPASTVPLPSTGPYFAFLTPEDANSELTLIGANGSGRKDIELPAEYELGGCFSCVLSPDGKWLAFWTGSAGSYDDIPLEGSYNLQLHLLRIANGAVTKITDLLSPDYPDNFRKNAAVIQGEPGFEGTDIGSIAQALEFSFLTGIQSAAWSPDGRYLAFAGEMDGPSSDLYVYDTSAQSVLRLSSGSTNILSEGGSGLGWSSDGKWIVYMGGYYAGEGMSGEVHAARPDGSDFRDFTGDWAGMSWISDSALLFTQGANGPGMYDLVRGDLDTGATATIWACPYNNYAVHAQGEALIDAHPGLSGWNCDDSGLFFVNYSTGAKKLLVGEDEAAHLLELETINQEGWRFLYGLDKNGVYAVSGAGEQEMLVGPDQFPAVSPDRQWVAFGGDGLALMDPSGKVDTLRGGIDALGLTWRPDSRGFLFLSGSEMFAVSLPEKTIAPMGEIQFPKSFSQLYWRPDSKGYFFLIGSDLYSLSLSDPRPVFILTLSGDPYYFDPIWVGASS
jgi:Tol biopolymer transport system component